MAAADGQTLAGQSPSVQQAFNSAYGGNAAAQWDSQHNAAIGGGGAAAPASGVPQQQYTNMAAVSAANAAAQIAYNEERLHLLEIPEMQNQSEQFKDQLAFQKAQQAWLQAYQTSQLSGYTPDANGNQTTTPTLERQTQQNQDLLNYLNLLGNLRGPANVFQYLKVLNGTPQGLTDVLNRASGFFGLNTQQPQPQPAASAPSTPATVNPDGSVTVQPVSPQTLLNNVNNPGQVASQQDLNAANGKLPNPMQWNARNVNAMLPSQRSVLDATYENQGWDPKDVEAMFQSSLPKYGAPTRGTVTGLFS